MQAPQPDTPESPYNSPYSPDAPDSPDWREGVYDVATPTPKVTQFDLPYLPCAVTQFNLPSPSVYEVAAPHRAISPQGIYDVATRTWSPPTAGSPEVHQHSVTLRRPRGIPACNVKKTVQFDLPPPAVYEVAAPH